MKRVMDWVKKNAAKWLLGYLPDVAVWAIQLGAEKSKGNEKVADVIDVVKRISDGASMVARIMEDGVVTEHEELEVRTKVSGIVDELEELL